MRRELSHPPGSLQQAPSQRLEADIRGSDDLAARHDAALRRWPRLWGEDRDLGRPGELSRALSRRELAHLHGLGGDTQAPTRRPRAGTLEAAVAGGRPFLAVGLEAGGRRVVVVAALRPDSADALAADEALIEPALHDATGRLGRALARASEVVLLVIEVPSGRHRVTRRLGGDLLERLRTRRASGSPDR